MRAQEFANSKLVIFDIDDTLVNTDTKVNVVRDGRIVKQLNSHDFTHYHLQPGEEFDFGAFRDAREFYTQARPIPGMIRQLKQDIATGNKVIMLTARSDFNDREVFLDTFRQYGIDMSKVHVYRAGNLNIKAATEEKKKIILQHLLGKEHYDKIIMYDDSVPNLNAFLSLKQDYPWSKFYAWHVDPSGKADEYHRTDIRVTEVSADRLQQYLNRAGQQVDRRQERMAQARERLNKSYEIYHADRPAGSSQIVDRFESDTPAEAQRYYEKFIQNYESDRDFDLQLRRSTGIVEDSFRGIDISMEKEDDEIMVQASAGGKQLGSVLFVEYDGYLMPQDLEVDERFRGQGIAQAMYDYVKSLGYRIRRSGQQTDAGSGFWRKHRPEQNVWEQSVAKGDKMSLINLDQSLADTPSVWKKFISLLPPQLARESVDERPRPDQDDIDFLTPLRLVSPQPVSVRVADLLRHPENQGTIGRSPDDVVTAVNQRWGLKIPSGKKYDPNPARYRAYAQMAPGTASPSVMADGVILFGAGRFVAAALRGDETMRVWSMTRKQGVKEVEENFADGRVKGKSRPGRVKRAGASCSGSVTDLRARAKKYGGERGKMYHWCANMKSGRKK